MILFPVNVFKDNNAVQNFLSHEASFSPLTLQTLRLFRNKFKSVRSEHNLLKSFYYLKSMDRKHSSIGLLSKVLSSLRPLALFRIKKVAANKHRVPIYCFGSTRQRFQAVEWLFSGSKFQTSNRDFVIKVSQEIFSASQLKGNAIAQRNAYHKLVSASRSLLKFLR